MSYSGSVKVWRARDFADEVLHPAGMYRMFVGVTCKLVCEVTPTNSRKMPTMALPHQQNHTYYTKFRETEFLTRRSAAVFLVLFERSKSTYNQSGYATFLMAKKYITNNREL
ncbi:MAG: hypothetical protein J6K81_01150 [Rikenellaceae bacterium]|nr:hypothetical protein [Rikenellaceae bacterium]